MELTFSDVYQPLFDLLEARSIVSNESFALEYTQEEQNYWIELSRVDTVLISGGRDSGKSFAVSCFNPIASRDYGHRVLYTRQTMASTDSSITEALDNRIQMLGYGHEFNLANKIYQLKPDKDGNERKGKIVITGQKTSSGTQTAKLKSLEDFSIFETDEGEELESYDSWLKVKRSMRAQDVQCISIIIFNPPTVAHWLYGQFYKDLPSGFNGVKDRTLYIHSTYLDNGKENMAEHNWHEYEDLRLNYELYLSTPTNLRDDLPKDVIKKYKEYKYSILGGFKEVAEGVVFEDWEFGDFNPNYLQSSFGQDFGFSKDPTTLIEVAIDKTLRRIYVKECLYKARLTTPEIININKMHAKRKIIVADSAEPRLITELQKGGCNMREAIKGAGSISAGVMLMQGYTIVVEHNSTNIVQELNNYAYADKGSKTYIDDFNHAIDAIRYNVSHQLMGKSRALNIKL